MLVGCGAGDSMGMASEFVPRNLILAAYPQGIKDFYPSIPGSPYPRSLRAGEITDDTMNTIFITEMLTQHRGKADAAAYIAHLIRWIQENPEKSEAVNGPSTRRALEAIQRGVPLEQSGILGTTNGAAMKISPVGALKDYRHMKELADQVEAICMPTHNTDIAIAGACAAAACVSYGIRGGADVSCLWDIALEAIAEGGRRGYKTPGVSLYERMIWVRKETAAMSEERALWFLQNICGTGVETAETIPAVLVIVSLAGGDVLKAAGLSATIGGDTDTIGAICGAICGAMNPDIPEDVVRLLEDVNKVDFEALARGLAPFCE